MGTLVLATTARRALVVVLAVVAALVAASLASAAPASAAIDDSARKGAVRGIDVSGHQHPRGRAIDFAKVRKSGYGFAFVKATEGRTFVNEYAKADGRASSRAGLATGFYHFARPGTSARAQARHFVTEVRRTGVRAPMLVLDLEDADGRSAAHVRRWTQTWLHVVERAMGQRPIIYTGPGFWKSNVGARHTFARYPLWIAHYETRLPTVPAPWNAYAIWQHSDSGRVPGVPGRADVNVAPRKVLAALTASDTLPGRAASAPAAAGRDAAPSVSRGAARPAAGASGTAKPAAKKPAAEPAAKKPTDDQQEFVRRSPVPDFLSHVGPHLGISVPGFVR
ncbi:glycoside hydrolase family 25 protein [Mumia sp. DW29H23]|uniref:glycoside hydrolase family 25 protein n=1 Tax=Mumia sp. DW29H23 TaxID=3421241 RepID=UPI003D6850E0